MSIGAPPRAPGASDPVEHAELEALIEEARQRARRRRQRYAGAALLLAVGGLAVYLGIAHRGGAKTTPASAGSRPIALRQSARNGPLTIFTATGTDGIATVETVGRGGAKVLWRCPGGDWCGEPVSSAWAPDGKRLAVALNEVAQDYPYPLALHVVNLASGRDVEIPRISNSVAWSGSGDDTVSVLGCWPPTELAWSPDGTRLVYRCGPFLGPPGDQINVLDLNAPSYRRSHFRVLPTNGPAFWPSWSPDGSRIAYSTAHGLKGRAAIYAITLDGAQRRLLATHATGPAWSPDGTRIAYESRCGLRLVTPSGRDVTPGNGGRCRAMGPRGLPGWSPDGTKIAIETTKGIYVVDSNGRNLALFSHRTDAVLDWGASPQNGLERPSWRPRQ